MPKNEDELRAWLAKQMKRDDPKVWEWLKEDEYVDLALNPDPEEAKEGREMLLEAARKFYRRLKQAKAGGGTGQRSGPVPVRLTASEEERGLAYSEYLAVRAAGLPRVREFRSQLLGGVIFTAARAKEFLRSPSFRFLSPADFASIGCPMVEHRSTLLRPERAKTPDQVWTAPLRLEWEGGSVEKTFRGEPSANGGAVIVRAPNAIAVWPGSVFHEMKRVADELVNRYPWQEPEAIWFLLTNTPPQIQPLRAGVAELHHYEFSRFTITLEVEPWVPASSVLKTYRELQKQLLKGDNRLLESQSVRVFRFVLGQELDEGSRPSWRTLLERWNAANEQDRFSDVRAFCKVYQRAEARIVSPDYRSLFEQSEAAGGNE